MDHTLLHRFKNFSDRADSYPKLSKTMVFFKKRMQIENPDHSFQHGFKKINEQLENTNRILCYKIKELNATTTFLNRILENVSQGVVFIHLDGTTKIYNCEAEKFLGVESERALFSNFDSNFQDDLFGFSLKEALNSKISPKQKLCSLKTGESSLAQKLLIKPFFNFNGEKENQGIFIFISNVTELKNLKKELSRGERLKELGGLTASIAHEIRNPLGGIEGFASLLQKDLENSPDQKQMASQIVDGARSLNEIVNNVLNYARPLKLDKKVSNIVSLIKKTCQWLTADFNFPKNIKIYISTKTPVLSAHIDESMIRSALFNLIKNSSEALPEGGKITIKVTPKAKFIYLEVIDNGSGIAQMDLEKIFEPFFTTKKQGNGLGLAEVKKIIRAHGGSIAAKSEVGKGTTFTIKLPLINKRKPCI